MKYEWWKISIAYTAIITTYFLSKILTEDWIKTIIITGGSYLIIRTLYPGIFEGETKEQKPLNTIP